MSDEKSVSIRDLPSLIVPAFGADKDGNSLIKQHFLPLEFTKQAESRHHETRMVNPVTYPELVYLYNAAYRELKANFADIGLVLVRAESEMENIRAKIILEKYPAFMVDKPRNQDTPDQRRSYVQLDPDYQKAQKFVGLIMAYEKLIEGRIKFMEKTVSYMAKQMDLLIRSGSHHQLSSSQVRK